MNKEELNKIVKDGEFCNFSCILGQLGTAWITHYRRKLKEEGKKLSFKGSEWHKMQKWSSC